MASTTSARMISIWHNNIGRPIDMPFGGPYEGRSGISPFWTDQEQAVREFVRTLGRYGAAILEDSEKGGTAWRNLSPSPKGVAAHDDADWCESRFREGSMAAYYENGEAWGGHQIAALR